MVFIALRYAKTEFGVFYGVVLSLLRPKIFDAGIGL